jgi:hypothetical protein
MLPPSLLPDELGELFELDADCAEALWALDQPEGKLDMRAMERDTRAALAKIPKVRARFFKGLGVRRQEAVKRAQAEVRAQLDPSEAYNDVPGRDPSC